METRSSDTGIQICVSAVLTASLLLIYPNRTIIIAPDWIVFAFSSASITILAAGVLLLRPERCRNALKLLPKWFHFALITIAVIALWHALNHRTTYGPDDIARSFSYLILPLFSFIYDAETRRSLPVILTVFWILDVLESAIDVRIGSNCVVAGLAMNKNWNAAMLLAVTPFVLMACRQKFTGKPRLVCSALILAISLTLVFFCNSAGAFIAFLVSGITCLYFSWKNLVWRRRFLSCAVISLILAGSLFCFRYQNRLLDAAQHNDRLFLYFQTPEMIADAPLFGHGIPSFEQDFLPYRTQNYFMRLFATDRVDHPHNHLLFMAAGTGLIGLAAWLILLAVPLCKFGIRRFRDADLFGKCAFFSFVLLLVHAQFDLILFKEPTNLFALFLLGILWRSVADNPQTASVPLPRPAILISRSMAAILICGAILMAACNLYASCHFRTAERLEIQGFHAAADEHYQQAAKAAFADNSAYYLYQTAVRYCTASKRDRDFALMLLSGFDKTETPDFAHIHLLLGRLLLSNGRDQEGVRHLTREAELYPLDLRPMLALWEYFLLKGSEDGARFAADE